MPDAVTATMPADAVMKKMETAVSPPVLAAFQAQHSQQRFWAFGEDRQYAVRKNIIPAHWFENGARQFQQFSGQAQPGEFYVFQVCLIQSKTALDLDCAVDFSSLKQAQTKVVSHPAMMPNQANAVTSIWIGIHIPLDATMGTYAGKIRFLENASTTAEKKELPEHLDFSIRVAGAALADGGTSEAWRLARLKWLDSTVGESDTVVTRPFRAIHFDHAAQTIDFLGRRISLGENGIPSQVTSYFSASNTRLLKQGRDAFFESPRLDCVIAGKALVWSPGKLEVIQHSATLLKWRVVNETAHLTCTVSGALEFDGNLQLSMKLRAKDANVSLDDVRFVLPWRKDVAKYAMGLGLKGGLIPAKHEWKWDVSKHQDAIWIGDVNVGAMLRFKGQNFQRPLINAYYDFRPLILPESWGSGGIYWEQSEAETTLVAHSGQKELAKNQAALDFAIDWYITPFKTLDPKKHFLDRYFHASQGAPVEDTAMLQKEGATIMEVHHNRLCNPYINYPYNDDSVGHLQHFIKQAHKDNMRVAVYYTTRELTQNIPEFFALKSMGGEIILPRREGVAWPVTNGSGPHPWLIEHVGDDIVPAWRENLKFPDYKEKLDLAVITTPDSRWNNFYLEGLDYLVKQVGIDGLYIDDTALDRKSMQRARRILDADGNNSRRVSMHSWNHFNGLAKWSNSSIAFMELYPYFDGLWHGEGFNANSSPDFMLVEMSGIPFGLMSEMLDHPNPWHGMVFGMRTRWPWSGDPRAQWQLEREFGIEDAEFIGWWDPACPVKSSNPDCKVSVFQKSGKTFVAIASWAQQKVSLSLEIDWTALGLAPKRASLWVPPCNGLQDELVYAPGSAIQVMPNQGVFLILDEEPREVKMPEQLKNPSLGLSPLSSVGPFEIRVPANVSSTKDAPWPEGATVAMAQIDPQQDAGQSWGIGMAVAWADGKYLQLNARTDGRWGICKNGAELLEGQHLPHQAAVVALRLSATSVQFIAQQQEGNWELIKEFPRAEFPGTPTTVRYGKIGKQWQGGNHSDPAGTTSCRVDWLKFFGPKS